MWKTQATPFLKKKWGEKTVCVWFCLFACECVCACKECVCMYKLISPVCLCMPPPLESFISLIRLIVVAAMASRDLALLEFVYRSDRVGQRNERTGGRLAQNKETVHRQARLMDDWKAFMNKLQWTYDRGNLLIKISLNKSFALKWCRMFMHSRLVSTQIKFAIPSLSLNETSTCSNPGSRLLVDSGLFACMTLAGIQGFLGLQIFFFFSDLKDDNLLMVNLSRKERKGGFQNSPSVVLRINCCSFATQADKKD